ncbi:putative uncharacterized protein CXorf58 [Patiria miniata]|uniref:Uncharacterized protein n=1 Tax=Patiria miniata TaxID=46514 RepID=A0A913ZFV1_PATMI|nr:putative uncharacterized protein CXorf58 [Patiria miniata]XP_038049861.1 putative uncharacterized protein CXorf58 [Patiria miniata]XP_038049862.1 putative uncharacterized protein CXorf58 [Patiria miniata]XP_038049863.1 putative uncharacterized protein CXorf58 [Patiria miniata]XP_038049865.1 putative uncharacterized protein CXorf58 [Patiria miniata]XP_038049866.1 putative uncharacterized protein CXorf58 [Patiria miniata]
MEPIRSTSRSTLNVTIPSEIEGSDGSPLQIGGQEVTQGSDHGSRSSLPKKTQPSPVLQQRELTEILAARAIERCWCSYRDRQMFKLLKHAICAAEHSLTHEILRKVSPMEAKLIRDPSLRARVRFRFAGSEFPPIILFKVFTHTEGTGLQYLSGKRCIQPASDAAVDACRMMGHRKFYDQLIADTCQHERDKITSEVDVTTVKDYMKYLSKLDEMPSYMGGRENLWRKLDQSVLPRTTILYDVIDYLNRGGNSPSVRLQAEMPMLTARPVTEEMQREHVRIISELREPLAIPIASPTFKPSSSRASTSGHTSRRSKQAKQRASRMRKMYMEGKAESRGENPSDDEAVGTVAAAQVMSEDFDDDRMLDDDAEEEEWQREADQLYAWTQDLSYEDIGLTTPC